MGSYCFAKRSNSSNEILNKNFNDTKKTLITRCIKSSSNNKKKDIKARKRKLKRDKRLLAKKVNELKRAKKRRDKELLSQLRKNKKRENSLKKRRLKCKLLKLNIDFINEKIRFGCTTKMRKQLQHRLNKLAMQNEFYCSEDLR